MDKKLIATILGILGFTSLELNDGKVSLKEDDVEKLQAHHEDKFGAELVLEGISYDDDGYASFQESEILAIEAALAKEAPVKTPKEDETDDEIDAEALKTEVITLKKENKQLKSKVTKLEKAKEIAEATVIKLASNSEEDIMKAHNIDPLKGRHANFNHSKTHLFSSGNSFDAFENRPWNQRAAGQIKAATDYTEIDITRINEDLGEYYRQDKTALISFLRAKNRLPAFWNTVSNVQDKIAYAKAFTGEVTQARKKKWLPKGKFEFQPEIASVFPIQIDLEIKGSELQSFETSWLNHLEMIKKEGSQPYKMSFITFLAAEFLKKAAEEDQLGHIRGIYIKTDDDAETPGIAIHKQDGLLIKFKDAQARRVYKPYSLGVPTEENIVDYAEKFVNTIPEYWRDMPGMVMYMANYWVDAYLKRRETLKGLMKDYDKNKLTVDRHENIRLVGLPFLNDSKFMFVTTDDNISLLENVPEEKTILEFEKSKRDIAVFGDYKIGIHVWAFGYEYPVGTDLSDDKQIFFSNDIEILPDLFIDIAADVTTPSVKYHTSLKTGVNTGATAITDILDASVGDYIYLKGNTGANPSTIANAGKFDLEDDITLDKDTMIILYKRGVDDFVEIERFDLAYTGVVFLDPDATTADADEGTHFITSANSGATALTDIENAIDGEIYKLEGGSDTEATTIAQSGKFSRISEAMTLVEGDWIKVKFNGLKFVELERYEA